MKNKPVAYVDNVWINRPDLAMELGIGQMFSRCQLSDHQIPLYTHQYERPHNTVLVPCDKLAEMQAEIEALKQSKFKDDNKVNFELTDEEWNKAFDFYCETDEGVLKFDFELRDEWKKEQLIRWKEALRKAQEK